MEVLIHTFIQTKATWGKRTCPRFETASVGLNPGPLDLETCALPTRPPRPTIVMYPSDKRPRLYASGAAKKREKKRRLVNAVAGTSKIRNFCVTTTEGEDETSEGNPENSKRDAVDVAPSVPAHEDEAAMQKEWANSVSGNPKNFGVKIKSHEKTQLHLDSSVAFGRWKAGQRIDRVQEQAIATEATFWRKCLLRIINIIMTLAMMSLALRGDRQHVGDGDCPGGNFLAGVAMQAQFDPVLQPQDLLQTRKLCA